jgi:hypothetical protein
MKKAKSPLAVFKVKAPLQPNYFNYFKLGHLNIGGK